MSSESSFESKTYFIICCSSLDLILRLRQSLFQLNEEKEKNSLSNKIPDYSKRNFNNGLSRANSSPLCTSLRASPLTPQDEHVADLLTHRGTRRHQSAREQH